MLDRVNKIQTGEQDSRQRPQPEDGPLTVLYEDDALIVLDKPPGIVVHPTYRNTSGTLLNAVLWRYRERTDVQPGILTRLDKDTSGVVVIALTPVLHAAMQREMSAGRVRKEYLAVVAGAPEPPQGRIAFRLGSLDGRPSDRRRARGRRDVRDRLRSDRPLGGRRRGTSLCVRCDLLTGRTHQIRVHLAASGWPIVGDAVYGQPSADISRQALHAWRVTLSHPVTRQVIAVTSPVPADIAAITPRSAVESAGAAPPSPPARHQT